MCHKLWTPNFSIAYSLKIKDLAILIKKFISGVLYILMTKFIILKLTDFIMIYEVYV